MRTDNINILITEGDYVIDPCDNTIRQIAGFIHHTLWDVSVSMMDGGCMSLSEISTRDIRLESEVIL